MAQPPCEALVERQARESERGGERLRDRGDAKRRVRTHRRVVPELEDTVCDRHDRPVCEQAGCDAGHARAGARLADDLIELEGRNHAGLLPYPATQSRPERVSSFALAAGARETTTRRLMALTKEAKQEIIEKHGRNEADTGSTQVQIAMLTQRINELTEHLRTHRHDHYSRRGLLKLVGRRRRFLTYLQKQDLEGYRALIKELGLRR